MAETAKPKTKVRPIVRLGVFFISHSIFFSVICFSAGVLALLLLPVFSMNTYISENRTHARFCKYYGFRSGSFGVEQLGEGSEAFEFEARLNNLTEKNSLKDFKRAGTAAAALVIKVSNRSERFEDSLSIYAEASMLKHPMTANGSRFWARKFGIPASEYVDGMATLASSLYYQAVGIPTGFHGAFRDYQIDAITVETSPKFSSGVEARRDEFILRGGRLIEEAVRLVNNLLENSYANNLNLTLEKVEPAPSDG